MVPPLNLSPSSTRLPDLDFSHLRDVVRASPDDDLAQARRFKHRVQHKLDGRQRRSGRTANWLSHTGQRALGRSFLKAWGFDDYGGDRETFEPDDVRVLPGRVVVSMPDGTLPLLHVPISIIDTLAPRKHDPLETRAQAARAFEEFCRRTVEGLLNRHSPMGQEDELGCWLIKKDKAPPPSRQRGRSRRPAGRGNGSAGTKSGKSRSSASATAKGTTLGSGSTTLYPPTSKSGRSTRLASVSQSGPDAPSTPRGASQSRGSSRRSSTLRSAASQADPVPPPRRVVVSDEAAAAISRYFASTAVCASPAGYTSGSGADKTDSDLPAGGSVPTVGQYSLESIYEDDDDVQVSVLQTFTVAPLEEEAVDEEEEEEGEDLLADGQMDPELAETLKELPPAPFAQRKARCEVRSPC